MKMLVESLWRLYNEAHAIDVDAVIKLCDNGKITEEEKNYILNIESI